MSHPLFFGVSILPITSGPIPSGCLDGNFWGLDCSFFIPATSTHSNWLDFHPICKRDIWDQLFHNPAQLYH